jgi:2-C-methyl-D-erythritol 4-phosphate cytidylyltransferase
MGTGRSKQFLALGGMPVLLWSVLAFERSPFIDAIVVVTRRRELRRVRMMLRAGRCRKVVAVVAGGSHRQDSVWMGLKGLMVHAPHIILIHDAVRPFVTSTLIRKVALAAVRYGGAIAAVPSKDTLKVSAGKGLIERTLRRETVWNAQTPQGFRAEVILDAFRKAGRARFLGTDDASLVERARGRVKIVEGSYQNIKITTAEDMDLARRIVKRAKHS